MSFTLQRFSRQLGLRARSRFAIPGATVSWMINGQESCPDKSFPLSDISKGGLSFLTNDPPEVKSELLLVIALPKNPDTIQLRGTVAYSTPRGPRLTYAYRVGVEFQPFALEDGCNSFTSREAIEALERIYGRHKRD